MLKKPQSLEKEPGRTQTTIIRGGTRKKKPFKCCVLPLHMLNLNNCVDASVIVITHKNEGPYFGQQYI